MVKVIGAGLAGVEASYYLANKGIEVELYEMRPVKQTSAHKTDLFAELICSNSLRANSIDVAVGLLKEEMKMFNSIIMEAAELTQVPAGGSLAVDRVKFANYITEKIKNHPNIKVITEEVTDIPDGDVIIATGPLTSDTFSKKIKEYLGENDFYFFDAVAPIIDGDSIDYNKVYLKSRYDKGEAAYLNCPMTKEEFDKFYETLINAECVEPHDFELKVFEGCMPFEVMAKRGKDTLLYGPMKPVGLEHNGIRPYAVVQLRKENTLGSTYNIVGFQTHLTWPSQKEVIKLIPGLENANILRYGVMHRNTYINSPKVLNTFYQLRKDPNVFFAGQMTGVEGYVESASSGLMCAINMYRKIKGEELLKFPTETMMGALANYISSPNTNFVPMNANYGIVPELNFKHHKKERKMLYGNRGIEKMKEFIKENNL
ncbi:MAG: methylenetetrahydrofolate--tRNA-(uracil(54)-C(5))-methyltransferase (FADH(2)-oxidizing) TrmFO [bacterium]|nr:methylenetetrahydrofolate--tRNA-(uracil(54)-C(5))-methyltransferase (FADH(2)-oxidizing) TrmFO [bacterium]